MVYFQLIATLALFAIQGSYASSGGCTINIQSLSKNQPLFLRPGGKEFFFPNGYRKISLNDGEQIELYCEKAFKSDGSRQKLALTCGRDNIDKYLECNDRNNEVTRKTNTKCNSTKDSSIVLIGFDVSGAFLELMQICYDFGTESAVYTKSALGPFSKDFQFGVEREFFKEGDFHKSVNVSRAYSAYIQKQTFGRLLGPNAVKNYFTLNGLARGHLAPMADFIYAPHQLATFYYINVAPQWHTFNSGNWLVLERGLRSLAGKRNLNLDVYTGTYGVSSLAADNNVKKELFLYPEGKDRKIAVPKLFYKIVVNRATQSGVVVIGVNNPHISREEIQKDYIICNDIVDDIKWLKFPSNLTLGYMYACTVPDFVKKVRHMQFVTKINNVLRD